MRLTHPLTLLTLTTLVSACGVPRESASYASQHANETIPADDTSIRRQLQTEGDRWTHLANLLLTTNELGGITGVNPKFTSLVLQTAALARRQQDLIAALEDTPEENRATLTRLHTLWQSADAYLNPK